MPSLLLMFAPFFPSISPLFYFTFTLLYSAFTFSFYHFTPDISYTVYYTPCTFFLLLSTPLRDTHKTSPALRLHLLSDQLLHDFFACFL